MAFGSVSSRRPAGRPAGWDFPIRDALHEALTDERAHLDVVEADVVGVRALEGGSVVADVRDIGGGSQGLDREAGGSVKRVHKQDLGAAVMSAVAIDTSVAVVPEALSILKSDVA